MRIKTHIRNAVIAAVSPFPLRGRGLLLLLLPLLAGIPPARAQEKHVALVVGCQAYGKNYDLPTPRADAEAVAKALQNVGWDVKIVQDPTSNGLRAALQTFGKKLDKNTAAFFYFSGHGFSKEGIAYLAAADTAFSDNEKSVFSTCIPETEVVDTMAKAKTRVVLLNSDRIPFMPNKSILENVSLEPTFASETLVAYDNTIGQSGYEIPGQFLNPYARRFAEGVEKSGETFVSLFKRIGPLVAADVKKAGGKQVPQYRSKLTGDLLIAANAPAPVPVTPVYKPDTGGAGEKYALLIGVEKYESPEIRALSFTLRDVSALKQTLPQSGFAPSHIFAMTSDLPRTSVDYPSNVNIVQRLDSFSRKLGPSDTLLIYFSGHGFQEQEGGQNFLGSVNANVSSPAALKITAVSLETLRDALKGLKASQLILIMDCCRNNPFTRDASKGGTDTNKRTASFTKDLTLVSDSVSRKTGTAILFACQEGQRSWEDEDAKQGAFTVFLMEGLRGKAARSGSLTMNDLGSYIETRMKEWSIRSGHDQSPDYNQYNRANIVLKTAP